MAQAKTETIKMNYETVIGLEVHVQLKTQTKAFCGCVNAFGARENTNICPVCLGLPGSLPVLNAQALKSSVKVALALHCAVASFTKFDRKNYFYPDLPKNFQISQYDIPLSEHGFLDIEVPGGKKRVGLKRIHLEEDAGKLIHLEHEPFSLVDFNRAGTPLLEIVSDPDLRSPQEAYVYLTDLKLTLEYLDVSDCDMEKGTLRCDANISLRPEGQAQLGVKTELKNMNSFKAVKAALEYEVKRQSSLLEAQERMVQETRLWDEAKGQTVSMRSKEEACDYRYFPEPDLPPFSLRQEEIEDIRARLPELPQQRLARFISNIGVTAPSAGVLISDKALADFFEDCLKYRNDPQNVANWIIGPVLSNTDTDLSFEALSLSAESLTGLIDLVEKGAVSFLAGKTVLAEMVKTGKPASEIIREKNLGQVSDAGELKSIIEEVIAANKKSVDSYQAGKENALMFLVGQAMKLSGGKANPKVVRDLLAERLKK